MRATETIHALLEKVGEGEGLKRDVLTVEENRRKVQAVFFR
jgi:hypothetical protein